MEELRTSASYEDTGPRPGDRWRQSIKDAAVPESLRGRSPEPAFTLEPEMFRWRPDEDARQSPRPSRLRALEALPEGGSVLDVGVGGGASTLGLVPRAGVIVGVDRLEGMLESFEESARTAGVVARAVLGAWPDVAGDVGPVDVAVCHHAIYGCEEVEDFLTALTAAARNRVVLEVSSHAPPLGLGRMWEAIHGVARPDRVVADELAAVIAAMGISATREDVVLPPRPREVTPERVAFSRRRLLVGPERDDEIAELLRTLPPLEHRVAAIWWPGRAPSS